MIIGYGGIILMALCLLMLGWGDDIINKFKKK